MFVGISFTVLQSHMLCPRNKACYAKVCHNSAAPCNSQLKTASLIGWMLPEMKSDYYSFMFVGVRDGGKAAGQNLFFDDSLGSFFRRLAWSPDGTATRLCIQSDLHA